MRSIFKPIFKLKKGSLVNLGGRKVILSGPHLPVPTFFQSTPPCMPPSSYVWSLCLPCKFVSFFTYIWSVCTCCTNFSLHWFASKQGSAIPQSFTLSKAQGFLFIYFFLYVIFACRLEPFVPISTHLYIEFVGLHSPIVFGLN